MVQAHLRLKGRFTKRHCQRGSEPSSDTRLLLNRWAGVKPRGDSTAQAPDLTFTRWQDESGILHASETSNGWMMHWGRRQSHPNIAQLFRALSMYPIPINTGNSAQLIASCFCPGASYLLLMPTFFVFMEQSFTENRPCSGTLNHPLAKILWCGKILVKQVELLSAHAASSWLVISEPSFSVATVCLFR